AEASAGDGRQCADELGAVEWSVPGGDDHDTVAARRFDDGIAVTAPTCGGGGSRLDVLEVVIEEQPDAQFPEGVLVNRVRDGRESDGDRQILLPEVGVVVHDLLGGDREA